MNINGCVVRSTSVLNHRVCGASGNQFMPQVSISLPRRKKKDQQLPLYYTSALYIALVLRT